MIQLRGFPRHCPLPAEFETLHRSCGRPCRSRERAVERGALIQLRFDPDPAAVPVDDTLANGKADTNAGNVFTVQWFRCENGFQPFWAEMKLPEGR